MLLKVLVFLVLLAHLSDAAVKMGLKRHELAGGKLLSEETFAKYHVLRTHRHHQKTRASRFATGKSGLTNAYNWIYTAEIGVGTPPQKFRLFLDITSESTWIIDSTIDDNQQAKNKHCEKNPCFESKVSSTYIKDGRSFFAFLNETAEADGFLGVDTFQLGDDTQKVSISNVTFGQANKAPFFVGGVPLDGVLGLALPSISKDGIESVFAAAVREKVVDKPIFTIWLNNSALPSESHGQITWGDVDSEHCASDITYFPLISDTFFVFELDGYSINDEKIEVETLGVMLDPLFPYVYVPIKALYNLTNIINATYDFSNSRYEVDCNVKFTYTFYAGEKEVLKIDEKVGVVRSEFNANKCFLSIESSDDMMYSVILGESFMKKWCTIYDTSGKGQIGYARSK